MINLSSPHTNLSLFLAVFFGTLFFPLFSQATDSLGVVINEIAWMGTETSYNDEWIELFNNRDTFINLKGWVLRAVDGTPEINLTGTIQGGSFYLLERTDDNTVPNIPADQIYTGALGNGGEKLELYDNFGNLIDSVNCSSGWFSGDNSTKQTMERKNSQFSSSDSDNWGTSQNSGGTPKTENSVKAVSFLNEPQPENATKTETKSELQTKEDLKKIIYPAGIIFNEILPSPEGSDEENEWIEIFNQNNFKVNLSNWQISDTIGAINAHTLPEGTEILARSFLVFSRPTTKIVLNNDGDSLKIIQPNDNVLTAVTYEKAPRGQSFNYTESGWAWSTILTPGTTNIISSSGIENEIPKSEAEKTKELEESQTKKQLATIGEQISKSQQSLLPFLIALILAIISGIIIIIFKRITTK